jgi:hypothetical protein
MFSMFDTTCNDICTYNFQLKIVHEKQFSIKNMNLKNERLYTPTKSVSSVLQCMLLASIIDFILGLYRGMYIGTYVGRWLHPLRGSTMTTLLCRYIFDLKNNIPEYK